MKKILVHNIEDNISDFLSEYKDLNILQLQSIKSLSSEEATYYDSTTNNFLFNKFKEKYNLKEFNYLYNTTFVKYKSIKIIKLPDFRNFIFYKNKSNFDIEKQNELKEKYDVIKNIFDKTLETYQNIFEKELDELPSNILNISDLSNSEDKYWFVKDKNKELIPEGKVIDYRSLLLLMELKNILKNEII